MSLSFWFPFGICSFIVITEEFVSQYLICAAFWLTFFYNCSILILTARIVPLIKGGVLHGIIVLIQKTCYFICKYSVSFFVKHRFYSIMLIFKYYGKAANYY